MKKTALHMLGALAAVLALAACSDYDNDFTEKKLKYITDFQNCYGKVDAQQDWNLAERHSVKVTVEGTRRVKIYALQDGEYAIVGDYAEVSGQQTLYFDVKEGVQKLLVSDGTTTAETLVGGSVILSSTAQARTRTVYQGNGVVTARKITDPNGYEIDGVTYPQYLYATPEETDAVKSIVPEIGHRDSYTNLNRVTHDFQYVSTGEFVIYPYYYQTSATNTLGIYYYDQSGVRQEVDIYKSKEGDELQYEDNTYTESQVILSDDCSQYAGTRWGSNVAPGNWQISNGEGPANFHANGWSTESDASGMKAPFYEYWRGTGNNLKDGRISQTLNGLEPGTYSVSLDARLFNEGRSATPAGVTFFANGSTIDLCAEGSKADYNGSALVYYNNLYLRCTVATDGKLTFGFDLSSVTGDWLAFKNIQVSKLGDWNDALNTGKSPIRRGQGIIVNVPEGTPFGMYLKTQNNNGTATFYSESELNSNPAVCGYGVRDDGTGNVTLDTSLKPSFASTFHVGDQMFLGFEDWTNAANESDFDLNDLVLAFSGSTPTIINEDPEPAATWLLACEDLGGTFDTDYNDVVFRVEHVSGQTFAIVTPLAAGGTLASYLFFEDPTSEATEECLGEIHQLFGAAPKASGEYTPTNVGDERGNPGRSITIPVSQDWTMAYYTSDNFKPGNQYTRHGNAINMGGFVIYVLPQGTAPLTGDIYSTNSAFGPASVVASPGLGNIPEMLCIPYTYVKDNYTYAWAWPKEVKTIADGNGGGAYPDFAQWVNDHNQKTDWYKRPYTNTVSELKWQNTNGTEDNPGGQASTKKDGGLFNLYAQANKPGNHQVQAWGFDTADHTATFWTGESFEIIVKLADDATGEPVIEASQRGTTGATISGPTAKWGESGLIGYAVTISGATAPGTITLTLKYAGNENYNANSINYTLTVRQAQAVRLTYTAADYKEYALGWYDGTLRLVSTAWGGSAYWSDYNGYSRQQWVLEQANDSHKYLYNVTEGKYLTFSKDLQTAYLTETAAPEGNDTGRYGRTDEGYIYTKRYGAGSFKFSVDAIADGAAVTGRKSVQVPFTLSSY